MFKFFKISISFKLFVDFILSKMIDVGQRFKLYLSHACLDTGTKDKDVVFFQVKISNS